MKTLEEIVAAIIAFGDKPALLKAFNDDADLKRTIRQPIFDQGHASATGVLLNEKKDVETKLDAAQKRVTELEAENKTLADKSPDVAKVSEEYKQQIRDLKAEHKTQMEQREKDDLAKEQKRILKSLEATFIAKGMKPIHAKARVKDDELIGRVKVSKDGARILQIGKSVPYDEEDTDKALALLADAVLEDADPEEMTSSVSKGSARRNSSGDTTGAKGSKKDLYDGIREKANGSTRRASEGEQQKGVNRKELLNQRLGR